MRRGAGLGLGGLVVVVIISLVAGKNPLEMLSQFSGGGGQGTGETSAKSQERKAFVAAILGETEDVWGAIFKERGDRYPPPTLVLFSGSVRSACGRASAAVGPFYCPGDKQVYIDLSFFDAMRTRLGGGGDFAEAYVLAHEVGHHVQTLTGSAATVARMRKRGQAVKGAGGAQVRQELQADCYAGVWAYHAQQRHHWLEAGDIEEALDTATAIGDDRLQRQARGQVVPDSFTHGTSAQRVRWFRAGFESGRVDACDTFSARKL